MIPSRIGSKFKDKLFIPETLFSLNSNCCHKYNFSIWTNFFRIVTYKSIKCKTNLQNFLIKNDSFYLSKNGKIDNHLLAENGIINPISSIRNQNYNYLLHTKNNSLFPLNYSGTCLSLKNNNFSCVPARTLTILNPAPLPKIPDSCKKPDNIVENESKKWKPRKFYWHTLPFYYASASKLRLTALVVLTTLGGCVLAPTSFHLVPVTVTCLGSFLCSCSANTLNQIFEYPHDSQSSRTDKRLLPQGLTSVPHLAFFAGLTAVTGLGSIYYFVNPITFALAFLNLILYSFIYTPMKQLSIYNTWVGSIVGAIPPLAGWTCLMDGCYDYRAFLLPLILYSWQFPHFNSLSWMIRDDYAKSGYQMMVNTDWNLTKRVTLKYSVFLCLLTSILPLLKLTCPVFAVLMAYPNFMLIRQTINFNNNPCKESSLRLFKTSLSYMTLILLLLYIFKVYDPSKYHINHSKN